MNPKKVYAIDPAVSNRLGFNFSENKGRILENIVYLELLRRGKEIYYHAGKSECDFLVKEGLKVTEAIQVAWTVDATNLRREIKGLQEAMRTYGLDTGVLIAYDAGDTIDTPDNITIIPAWQWLLEE